MKVKKNWPDDLYEILDSNNLKGLRNIPKVDLHCHSITSVPVNFFKNINPKLKLPPKNFKNLRSFNQYLRRNINPLIKNVKIFRSLLRETFQKLIAEGVVYTEMSFDLTLPEYFGISMEEYLDIINEERELVSEKIKICIEAGIDREVNPQKTLLLFKKVKQKNIIGSIDIYGDETKSKIDEFIELYRIAGKNGLKLKAHVGEIGDALSVKEAVKKLHLDALQHGIRAVEDEGVVDYLIKKGVVFNICPTSNLSLGLCKNIKNHPIKKLFDMGAIITVGSDNFSIFEISVSDELTNLYKEGIFNKEEIKKIINNGLEQIRPINY